MRRVGLTDNPEQERQKNGNPSDWAVVTFASEKQAREWELQRMAAGYEGSAADQGWRYGFTFTVPKAARTLITKLQLFEYFFYDGDRVASYYDFEGPKEFLNAASFTAIKNADLTALIVAWPIKNKSIDAEEVFERIGQILDAKSRGHKIIYWNGHDGEMLVAVLRDDRISVPAGYPVQRCSSCGGRGAVMGERAAFYMSQSKLPCPSCASPMAIVYERTTNATM